MLKQYKTENCIFHTASVLKQKYQSVKSSITQVERNKLHDIFHKII